jgi:hypothetical protein
MRRRCLGKKIILSLIKVRVSDVEPLKTQRTYFNELYFGLSWHESNCRPFILIFISCSGTVSGSSCLTLSLLMSYIYGAPCKARNFNVVIYMDVRLATLKAVSFYSLHNVSILNQCRKLSCITVVCKHFASYRSYPNNR